MIAAVSHAGGPVDVLILLRRLGVSVDHRCRQVPGRQLTADPL